MVRRLLGQPCFAYRENSVTVHRSTDFPNLAPQKIDVRFSVVVMEFYSSSNIENFVTFDLDHSAKKSSLVLKVDCIISLSKFRQS